ncbi:hypothetical protein ACFL4K_02370, partial [Candidatus Neomarinimicrobiota bacterium]
MKQGLVSANINALTIVALVLLPFDSVPGIFPSVYRPVSLLFLLPGLLMIVFRAVHQKKLDLAVSL